LLAGEKYRDGLPGRHTAGALPHSASVREDISSRGSRVQRNQDTYHGAIGIGLSRQRLCNCGRGKREWSSLAVAGRFVLILIFVIFAATGCKRAQGLTPAQASQESWLKLKQGHLNDALQEVDLELRSFPDPNTEWHWRFRTLKAEILLRKRLNQQVLALLAPDFPVSLGTTDVAVWRKLTQGSAYGFLFQFEDSDRLLAEAQGLATQYHPDLLGEIALRRGTLSFLRGDATAAASSYRNALSAARAQSDAFLEAASVGSLGLVAAQQEHYDESIGWDRDALRLSQSIGAQGSVTNTLGNMAWSYFELGDYVGALELFHQGEESAAKENNTDAMLEWRINASAVEFYSGNYKAAEQESQEALTLSRRVNHGGQSAQCLSTLAEIALARGQVQDADLFNTQALELFHADKDRGGELGSLVIQASIENSRQNRQKAEQLLNEVIADRVASASERWEAEARLATVYQQAGLSVAAEREFREAITSVETARSSIQDEELRVSFLTNAIEFYDDYVEFLISQRRIEEALHIAALTRARTLVEGLGLGATKNSARATTVDWSQASRRADAIILCYWLGSQHSYLWAISASGPPRLFQLPPKDQIDPVVQAYGEALLGSRDVLETADESGKRLYEMLVAPARNLIPQGSRVVIIPDGSLYGLNFETLLVPSPALHYWIEDAVVSYSDSLLLVAAARAASPARQGKLLLIGDPVSSSVEFPALPQAAVEMRSVEKYFPADESEILEGDNATPQAYLGSDPGQFSFIHFTAHGTSSRIRPLESAVILTEHDDSSKLYGRDVVKLPLHAELVTISACKGAGSRNYSGEGLVGLSWAFLRAGARGVIAALWDVNDASTASLMDGLYGQISRGKDPATALRNTKLALLHSGTVYQKPFYWAPFQFYMGSASSTSNSPLRRE
jgi:CHAT domain-containing protein